MGAMKELGATLAVEYHTNPALLKERLKGLTAREQAWHLSQLPATRNWWDGNGAMLEKPRSEQTLEDKFFIGGEGIPDFVYKICRKCLWEMNSLLGLGFISTGNDYRLRSELLPELVFIEQKNADSCPVDELEGCACGNWFWDRAGHDVVLEAVARGRMSAKVATQWLNRNFSYELDTRAYNADFISQAIVNWESRWLA